MDNEKCLKYSFLISNTKTWCASIRCERGTNAKISVQLDHLNVYIYTHINNYSSSIITIFKSCRTIQFILFLPAVYITFNEHLWKILYQYRWISLVFSPWRFVASTTLGITLLFISISNSYFDFGNVDCYLCYDLKTTLLIKMFIKVQ